ncbi:hypothetical protein QTH87_23805 [Variovorax sp. J22P168]|uniref:hypothetical protein n=1 Tax=Variovorax jilinensis TaxID=3053513 RepID=UPI002575A1C1|nr:hypothetical protein [Variovorax sp. J22P168]MDM0015487.1 hypothetical protein [Variovorax sp. J22P168]
MELILRSSMTSNRIDEESEYCTGSVKGNAAMQLVITQNPSTGRWQWVLQALHCGPMAKGTGDFTTRQALFDSLRELKSSAPRSLAYDPLGGLYEGV